MSDIKSDSDIKSEIDLKSENRIKSNTDINEYSNKGTLNHFFFYVEICFW